MDIGDPLSSAVWFLICSLIRSDVQQILVGGYIGVYRGMEKNMETAGSGFADEVVSFFLSLCKGPKEHNIGQCTCTFFTCEPKTQTLNPKP